MWLCFLRAINIGCTYEGLWVGWCHGGGGGGTTVRDRVLGGTYRGGAGLQPSKSVCNDLQASRCLMTPDDR